MKSFKKIASLICATAFLLSTVALTGCMFDLGVFEDDDDYVESFGTISLASQSEGRSYSVGDDFYNSQALEHFESHVIKDEYTTFVLPFERQLNVDEIKLSVITPKNVAIQIKMFVGDLIPPFYNDFDEGGTVTEMPTNFVAETTVYCTADEWTSFTLSSFLNDDGYKETVTVNQGEKITLLFLNNTAWGKALGLENCELALTALLVRAI